MSLDSARLTPLSGETPNALIILLHGYGSNSEDLIAIARMIQPALPGAAFIAPNAPSRMPQLAAAFQWWSIETFSMAERAAGADAAAAELDAFITQEAEAAGLPSNRVLLIGFSQGTMMALHVGLRRRESLAGIIGISGMLVAPERVGAEIESRPPVLLIHGTEDDVVPFRSMGLASSALSAAGVPVEIHESLGVAHSVGQDGLAAATAFAVRTLR